MPPLLPITPQPPSKPHPLLTLPTTSSLKCPERSFSRSDRPLFDPQPHRPNTQAQTRQLHLIAQISPPEAAALATSPPSFFAYQTYRLTHRPELSSFIVPHYLSPPPPVTRAHRPQPPPPQPPRPRPHPLGLNIPAGGFSPHHPAPRPPPQNPPQDNPPCTS